MGIVFRTDSSTEIGSGHVMRCLTLAEELRNQGATIAFICREHEGNLCNCIAEKGFTVYRLPSSTGDQENLNWNSHAKWLCVPWEQDARETSEILRQQEGEVIWLILDHYALDIEWERQLRPLVRNIMVIDDLADRPHDCDILLDQNLYENMESRYTNLVPEHCRTFLGPRYALLRPEFAKARNQLRHRDGIVRRIFIFFGGSDLTNETTKALQAIQSLNRPDIAVDVVIGSANPHREEIQQLCDAMEHVTLHCNVDNMAELMAKADLALGAGGATSWERCCLGLPALVIATAFNQVSIAENLSQVGWAIYLGLSKYVHKENIIESLRGVILTPNLMISMADKMKKNIDATGAVIITVEIFSK